MDEAFYRSYFEIEGRHWWFLGRRRLFLRLIEDRFGARRPIDMLDFGCGTGAFLEHLERFGAVSAVDSDASAVAFCHTRGRTEVQLVPADASLPFPDASFDLVTALDVVKRSWPRPWLRPVWPARGWHAPRSAGGLEAGVSRSRLASQRSRWASWRSRSPASWQAASASAARHPWPAGERRT
jgi:SAM-dependent methyltransferase